MRSLELATSSFNFWSTFSALDLIPCTEFGLVTDLKMSVIEVCLLIEDRRLLGDSLTWDSVHQQRTPTTPVQLPTSIGSRG